MLLSCRIQCTKVMIAVITKVFPDEYHLHTLDLMLTAISRLNPHVDLKKIVIGLMDRLSSYGVREAESAVDPAARKQAEEEAVAKLLEKVRLTDQSREDGNRGTATGAVQENGTKTEEPVNAFGEVTKPSEEAPATNGESGGAKPGIPADIKLYEIFYEQVVNLIKARGLPIQDIMALLVSLVNLAL